jgi:signal transduction histidine kinase
MVRTEPLPLEEEGVFNGEAEATITGADYPLIVNRPLITALGWRLPPRLLDIGPVAFILLEGTVAIAVRPGSGSPRILLAAALVVSAIALLLRHRAPIGALAVILAVALGLDYGPIVTLPTLLALFTVSEYSDRATVGLAAVVTALVIVGAPVAHGDALSLPGVLSRLVAVGLAVSVGLWLRARADYVIGLQERAERLERERELLAQQAVADERLRIARELHDVVAHNVSLMVVQAQALAATAADDDEQSQAVLGRVAGLGREALSEMHRMLGVLRLQNGDGPEREPQPGVRDIEKLIERTRETGLDARLEIEGEPSELSTGVDLSAYRIVQEALTNVVRHAHAQRAVVTLTYAPRALQVTIVDDGSGSSSQTNGQATGHGLVGMRERVALFGGELHASPDVGGRGYRVRALLPLS